MVGASNCAVPGCSYTRKRNEKRSLFTLYRPDLAKSQPEKEHRQLLANFILSMRDSSADDDDIKHMLHKESAGICEDHFVAEDIIQRGRARVLKCGAKPCRNLPKSNSYFSQSARKAPLDRSTALPIFHKTFADVRRSMRRLSETMKDHWKVIDCSSCMQLFMQERGILIPKFSIRINVDCMVTDFAIYGWPVDFLSLQLGSIQTSKLFAFVCCVENLHICKGLEMCLRKGSNLIPHPVLVLQDQKVVSVSSYHSVKCTIYCLEEQAICSACFKLNQSKRTSNEQPYQSSYFRNNALVGPPEDAVTLRHALKQLEKFSEAKKVFNLTTLKGNARGRNKAGRKFPRKIGDQSVMSASDSLEKQENKNNFQVPSKPYLKRPQTDDDIPVIAKKPKKRCGKNQHKIGKFREELHSIKLLCCNLYFKSLNAMQSQNSICFTGLKETIGITNS